MSHIIGTITPWANAVADAKVTEKARHARIAIPLNLIFYLLKAEPDSRRY
jgi:hypothetical protein